MKEGQADTIWYENQIQGDSVTAWEIIETPIVRRGLAVMTAFILGAGIVSVPTIAERQEATAVCTLSDDEVCDFELEMYQETPVVTVHFETEVATTTTTSAPLPTTTLPPVSVPPAAINREITAAPPEAIATIEAMNLTIEGYKQLFDRIDYTWYDYAQQFVNFNPDLVSNPDNFPADRRNEAIQQHPTEWITAHFTAIYVNPDGPGQEPIGEMSAKRLIDFLGNDRGVPCCGINFIIDRNGTVIQTAPFDAKLRHNPPYDGLTTGFEMEGAYQHQLNTKEYEAATYLTIAMLQNDGLLGAKPLRDAFQGHGANRDAYRQNNPGSRWDQRNDFDQPIMDVWLAKIETFLASNMDIPKHTQKLR